MSLILWDGAPKAEQPRYFKAISTVSQTPPTDVAWTGQITHPAKGLFQAELRWNCRPGQSQALMIVAVDGWHHKRSERPRPRTPGTWEKDTSSYQVRLSSNAALWFTQEEFAQLPLLVEETLAVLSAVYKEFT